MKKLLLSLLLLPLICNAGGPWVKQKNKSYSQIGITTKSYSGRYIGTYKETNHVKLNRDVKVNQLWFYSEYGLGKKMELSVNAPFSMISTSGQNTSDTSLFLNRLPTGKLNAFDNLAIGLKRNFINKKWLVSGQLNVNANTSSRNITAGLQSGYNAWGITPKILFGKGKEKSFLSGDVGVSYLTNKYATSGVFNVSYGGKLTKSTWLIGEINGLISFENGKVIDINYSQTALYVDNQGFIAYGVKIAQNITDEFALNLGAYSGFGVVNQGSNSGQLFFSFSYSID